MQDRTLTSSSTSSITPQIENFVEPRFCSKTTFRQIGFSTAASLLDVSVGMAIAFADRIPEVEETIPLTLWEKYWINLSFTLSMAGGSLLSGFIMDQVGRKASIILTQMPLTIGWLVTGMATTAGDIILGRIILGLGCGMSFPVIVYPTEISLPKIRGVVCTFPHIARSLGVTLQVGLGFFFTWTILSFFAGIYNTLLCFAYLLIPESPYFLTMTGNMNTIKRSLHKLRGPTARVIYAEMDDLQDFKESNDIRSLTCREVICALILWSTIKPFLISLGYFGFVQLSGAQILFSLGQNILIESKTSMSVAMAKFTHSCLILISGFATTVIIYRLKRKTMAVISATGVFVICMVLGTVIRTININSVSSQVLYGAYAFFSTLGYYTIAYIMMTEIYPLQLRGLMIGITLSLSWFMQAICSDILFVILLTQIGLSNVLYFFGTCSFFGAVYCFFILPETKDLTLVEIEEYFNHRRPTLVSQRRVRSQQMFEEQNSLKKVEISIPLRISSDRISTESEIKRKKTTWSELLGNSNASSNRTSSSSQ